MCSHIEFSNRHYYVRIMRHAPTAHGFAIRLICFCPQCQPQASSFTFNSIECVKSLERHNDDATKLMCQVLIHTHHENDGQAVLKFMNHCDGKCTLIRMNAVDDCSKAVEIWWAKNMTEMNKFRELRLEQYGVDYVTRNENV